MHRLWLKRQDLRGLEQLLRGLHLALGIDDPGAPLALRLGLAGDGADHALVQVHVLDLDVGDLDAPGVGLLVEDALDVLVELVALGEHLVQLVLAEHRAQRGLCQLAGGHVIVLHLNDHALRIDHPEVDHRVDLDRDVVARDDVLARHIHDDRAQVHPHHLLHDRDDDHQSRPLHLPEAAEQEHHAPLILAQDPKRVQDQRQD